MGRTHLQNVPPKILAAQDQRQVPGLPPELFAVSAEDGTPDCGGLEEGVSIAGMNLYYGIGPLKTAKDAYYWNQQESGRLSRYAEQIAALNKMPLPAYHAFLKTYRSASLVLWLDDIRMAALSGFSHFMGHTLTEHSLNPSVQLWVTSTDIEIKDLGHLDEIGIPRGFTVGSQLVFIRDQRLFNFTMFVPSAGMEYTLNDKPDQLLPRIRMASNPLTAENDTIAKVFAMIEFMNLPIADLSRQRLDRPERRRLQKQDIPEPDLRVVTLRKREYVESGESREVDWSCRWIVGGHWRKQWCPSTKTHRPTFIAPYVKGPDDKPLKTDSGERVYVVKQ